MAESFDAYHRWLGIPSKDQPPNHYRLLTLEPFESDPIGATFKTVAQDLGVKTGVLVHPARLACSGNTAGPSLYHLMAILGKDKVLKRIDLALARIT